MTQPRLIWLLGVMCVLAIARVILPSPADHAPPVVAEAIVRNAVPIAKVPATPAPTVTTMIAAAASMAGEDVPGNAFAVRPPPPPSYVPPVPLVVAKVRPVTVAPVLVAPPVVAEPPTPPMPYRVIGTWDDGKGPGVFLAGPSGTLLARQGSTLGSEYRVSSVTPQQISLRHIASKRETRLAISKPPDTPRAYP